MFSLADLILKPVQEYERKPSPVPMGKKEKQEMGWWEGQRDFDSVTVFPVQRAKAPSFGVSLSDLQWKQSVIVTMGERATSPYLRQLRSN